MTFIAHFALAACTANESAGFPPPEDSGAGDSGADTADSAEPVVVVPTWTWQGHTAVEVAASEYSACATDSIGITQCWGTDSEITGIDAPPNDRLHGVSVGEWHGCGILDDGSAVCWGCGSYWSSDGDTNANYGQCQPPVGEFVKLSVGSTVSYGLDVGGTLWRWGGSIWGEQELIEVSTGVVDFSVGGVLCTIFEVGGLSCSPSQLIPAQPYTETIVRVESGYYDVCAQDNDGVVLCWGLSSDFHGKLPTVKAIDFAAGKMSTCLIHADDGRLECIGSRDDEFPLPTGSYTQIAGNSWLGYAIRDDGVLVRWGDPDEEVICGD